MEVKRLQLRMTFHRDLVHYDGIHVENISKEIINARIDEVIETGDCGGYQFIYDGIGMWAGYHDNTFYIMPHDSKEIVQWLFWKAEKKGVLSFVEAR
jgi:hypothetical protein